MKLLIIGAIAAAATAAPAFAGDVTVSVSGVKANGGEVYAVLQRPAQFLKAQGAYRMKVPASADTVQVVFRNVKPGDYAAAVFQDSNGDGKTAIGKTGPSEPWGLSGGEQTGKPQFMTAKSSVTSAGGSMSVALKPMM